MEDLACYRELWIKPSGDDHICSENTPVEPAYLYEFIFEACRFFSNNGYFCDPSEIYSVLGRMGEVDVKKLLYSLIVHSSDQSEEFDPLYEEFISLFFKKEAEIAATREAVKKSREETEKAKKEHEVEVARIQKKIRQLNNKKEKLQAEKRKVLEEQNSKEIAKAEKTAKKQEKVRNLKSCFKGLENLSDFVACVKNGERPEQEKLTEEIKEASLRACSKPNSAELLKEIREIGRQLKAIKDKETSVDNRIKMNNCELERSADDLKRQEKIFDKKLKDIEKRQKEISKEKPVQSRTEMDRKKLKNAVHSKYEGDVCLDKKFSRMSAEEKQKIYEYIRENARKFRTKLSRKIRVNRASKVDIPATVKKSCQTGGIPLCLIHQKPVRQKSNLVLILDVSGSCKEASELMLVFMHAMKEVFPGGCATYAFTNKLYDISVFMEMDDASTAVSEVLKAIPRSGAYSNYEVPFRTFYRENMSKVTGDSYVYIIGDARNNKNPSGEEYVKAIARKAKKAFWLNTEEMEEWNTGDSIIGTYAKYMTKVAQTTTAAELLGFLEN